jgi:proteasome lid subunit RPN8/RPN11
METGTQSRVLPEQDPSAQHVTLQLDGALVTAIVEHLRASLPTEGCGVLAVRRNADGTAVATRFYPGTNVDASPTRYTMDPVEVLAAFRDLDAHGWTLGAIVHSHPATPPTPSPTDLREAFYPEALMVIVSFAATPPSMRAWRLSTSAPPRVATEVPIVLPEGA